jgi:hypothetical protein
MNSNRPSFRSCAWLFVAYSAIMLVSGHVLADMGLGDRLKPDVRLLIDISGSMKDSDPENLRAPALDLIVRLLPEGSKAGVWVFGHDIQVLVEHRVIDEAWREEAANAVAQIDNSGQLTNIPAALDAALYDFERLDPGYRTSIILLTDGKVDISESPMTNARAARALLAENAQSLAAAGIPVHTVALSDEADWNFLNALATSTGGLAEKAQSAEKLTGIFYQSLEMVAPTSRVPIAGASFSIDSSVHEFTALIFYADESFSAGLVGPTNKRYDPATEQAGVEWFRNRKFALVTVRAPEPGIWKLVAPDEATTRVTVVSDLQLEVDPLPNSLPAGKRAEMGLRLREQGKVLSDPEVLAIFKLVVEVENPKGEVQTLDILANYAVPDDGEFRVVIPGMDLPGRYKITARLQGDTLQRELPMVVELLASPSNGVISTRGDALPDDNFQAPIISFGGAVLFFFILLYLFLRRRKRKKLDVWQRRNIELADSGRGTGTKYEAVSGMRAPVEEQDS